MSKILTSAAMAAAMMATAPCAGSADGTGLPLQCTLKEVASLHTATANDQIIVPASLNGRDTLLMIDTGAPVNIISERLVSDLNLPLRDIRRARLLDGAGEPFKHFTTVQSLRLGSLATDNVKFVAGAVTNEPTCAVCGSIGNTFLSDYDIELDPSHGKMNWFLQDHCTGQVVYWTREFAAIPFRLDASSHIVVTVTLDGEAVAAMVDTGSLSSKLRARAAKTLFNIDPAADGATPDGSVTFANGADLPYYRHRFHSLRVGDVEFRNIPIDIIPDSKGLLHRLEKSDLAGAIPQSALNVDTPLVIGMRDFSKLRTFIAYSEGTLYVSKLDAQD